MKDITQAEMKLVLTIIKSPEIEYNAHSLAQAIGITSMGALKILKRLEKETILKSRKVGQASIYALNHENPYAQRYAALLLSRESRYASPQIKRWVQELKKIKNASIIILFGSILANENPHDIDVLLVTDKRQFPPLQKEIQELNQINVKQIHPLYQTKIDLIHNIKKGDKPVLNAIKGIIIKGEEQFLEIYYESRQK